MSAQASSGPARIVLVAMAGVLRDIVTSAVEADPQASVVAEARNRTTLEGVLGDTPADVVIWRLDDDVPDGFLEVFDAHPRIKVLALRDDGRRGFLWELRPHRTALGELSPTLLADTVRKAVTP